MKVDGDGDIDEHDVQVRRVVRTYHIRLPFFENGPAFDRIEYAQWPDDQVSPDFLDAEDVFEPLFPLEQDKEYREEQEKRDNRVYKKKRSPDPP
jgi:hypothetical protein